VIQCSTQINEDAEVKVALNNSEMFCNTPYLRWDDMRIRWKRKIYIRIFVYKTLENQALGTLRRWEDNVKY
jgi:hypothetical protein